MGSFLVFSWQCSVGSGQGLVGSLMKLKSKLKLRDSSFVGMTACSGECSVEGL